MTISSLDSSSSSVANNLFNEEVTPLPQSLETGSTDTIQSYQLKCDWRGFFPFQIFRGFLWGLAYVGHQIRCAFDFLEYVYESWASPKEPLFPDADVYEMRKVYWGLGGEKWKEAMEGVYHYLGKWTFDEGHHQGVVEMGYMYGIERAFNYISRHLNTRMTANMYLKIHKKACGHFNGDPKVYIMGQEQVGAFRGSNDSVFWNIGTNESHRFTDEAIRQLEALDPQTAHYNRSTHRLSYVKMSQLEVHTLVERYFDRFYEEIGAATNDDEKLQAIANLITHMQWLHAPHDGSGRTDLLVLNKLLAEHGFHPVLLKYPYHSSSRGYSWVEELKQGLKNWEAGKVLD